VSTYQLEETNIELILGGDSPALYSIWNLPKEPESK